MTARRGPRTRELAREASRRYLIMSAALMTRPAPSMLSFRTAALLTAVATSSALAQRPAPSAQDVAEVRAKYVKREVRIAMRDGAQLFTSIYIPRDTTRPYPIMMSRTPYG